MKKLMLFICALALSVSAYAQKGISAAGINLSVSPVNESGVSLANFGIAAKYQYGVTDHLRLEAVVGYDFKDKGVSVFTAGVNGNWLFNIGAKFKIYPIVGIGYANIHGFITWDDDYDMEGAKENYDKWFSRAYDEDDDYYDDDDISNSANKFYYNLGVGFEYDITSRISATIEGKYQGMKWFNRIPISVGVAYKF